MEWTVVTVLIAVAGLFGAVGAPVIRLNSTIARLNVMLEQMKQDMAQQKLSAREAHRRLWAHNDAQDASLADHEQRIVLLEHKERSDP